MAALAAGTGGSRRWGRPAAARARVSPSRAGSLRPPPLLRPELSHRCPATILGWPQTRTRIAFGQSVAKPPSSGPRSPAGLRFAPQPGTDQGVSGAARLQLPGRRSAVSAHAAVRWTAGTRISSPRGESPSPQACVSFDRGPGALEWPTLGLSALPQVRGISSVRPGGTPTPLSPPPSPGFPGSPGIRGAGAEAGWRFRAGVGWLDPWVPRPRHPRARTGSGALRFPVAESRPGRRWRRGALECAAGSPVLPGEPGWEPAGWRGARLSPSGRLWRLGAGAGF